MILSDRDLPKYSMSRIIAASLRQQSCLFLQFLHVTMLRLREIVLLEVINTELCHLYVSICSYALWFGIHWSFL